MRAPSPGSSPEALDGLWSRVLGQAQPGLAAAVTLPLDQ